MKIKHLFYALLALPLVFASCEELLPNEKPNKPVVKEPVLTLTSAATLEFLAEGGEGEIAYTLENAVEGVEVEATSEAEWIADIAVAEKVTFVVAANEGEAREAKVVVAYGQKNFEVAVKQAAKVVEEPEKVNVEAQILFGEYYGDGGHGSDVYYIILSDVLLDEEVEEFVPGKYYSLAVYAEKYTGEWSETMSLPVGEYTLDVESTYAAGTIDYEESIFMNVISTEEDAEASLFDAAVLAVTETGTTLTATVAGVEHVVTFAGEHVIYNFTEPEDPEVGDAVEFEASYFGGTHYDVGVHNYYIVLSDAEVDGSYAVEGATYYYFDLYSNEANENLTLPNGVYTFDATDSCAHGTFTAEYGFGFKVVGTERQWYLYDEGSTITVTDGKIVAELIMTDGTKHIVTYEGDLSLSSAGGGPLEGDLELNATNTTIYASYYGNYYSSTTDNWFVEIFEDAENGNGMYIILDLLADYATSDDYRGTFTGADSYDINTYVFGYLDEGYLMGCWYAEISEGAISGVMAPMMEGTITVNFNEDGTQTFVFDCVDDLGNEITGSVSGAPAPEESAAKNSKKGVALKQVVSL